MAGNGCSGTYRVTAVSVDNETHPEIDARRLLPDLSSSPCEEAPACFKVIDKGPLALSGSK
ncbi:hypothetical protein [Paraburkholderia hospita]|uniref:hypothetical protein n=1 Tax=Paraburkholderia hospita TaxID=169430 RepID=UPI000DEF838A|nr:hypothetical protein [Paraburkholderia hospita]AXF06015.1 hypothetical protein CUJ88_47615 [Paraburkholderia hospita]